MRLTYINAYGVLPKFFILTDIRGCLLHSHLVRGKTIFISPLIFEGCLLHLHLVREKITFTQLYIIIKEWIIPTLRLWGFELLPFNLEGNNPNHSTYYIHFYFRMWLFKHKKFILTPIFLNTHSTMIQNLFYKPLNIPRLTLNYNFIFHLVLSLKPPKLNSFFLFYSLFDSKQIKKYFFSKEALIQSSNMN